MKKLMIAAAIVCAAVMSQAASVTWSTGTGGFWSDSKGVTSGTVTGGELVLVLMKGGLDWSNYSVIPTTPGTTTVNEKTTLAVTTKSGTTFGQIKGTVKFTYEAANEGSNFIDNGDVLALMFKDEKGTISRLVYAGTDPLQNADTYVTVSGLSLNTSGPTKSMTLTGNITSNVPEPTSAMLLLLGVAGLALRRRRA